LAEGRVSFSFEFGDASVSGYPAPSPGVDFHANTMLVPAFGYLLVLNGIDENRKIYDPARRAQEGVELLPLVSDGPAAPILPMTSGMGSGRIFGHGYLWLYRYYDSRTGNATGFSPYATELTNLGDETYQGASTFVGQDAYFYLAGISTSDTQFDRIQVFRNTSGQQDVFFLDQEVANPGQGARVLVVDSFPDEEIAVNTTAGILPNSSVQEGGVPWPCPKGYVLPIGRVLLYGLIRHPPVRVVASATNGENVLTASVFLAKHVGRRFLPVATSGGAAMTPTKSYHIAGRGGNIIYPDWAESTASNFIAEIEDDRDMRAVFVSEPGLPCQYDFRKTLYIGRDQLDGPQHIFSLGTMTYAILLRRIVALENINSLDPSLTLIQTVVAEEGQCGLWAGVETPEGYAYLHEKRGMRLFDGSFPRALGSVDPRESFMAKSQFEGIEPAYMNQTRVFYDPDLHLVLVSYHPLGCGSVSQVMAFDTQTQTWRGPWRESITTVMQLTNDDGSKVTTYGDVGGNLSTADGAAYDVVLSDGAQLSGTVGTVDGPFIFIPASGSYDVSSDRRIVGRPILLIDGSGGIQHNRVAGYDSSTGAILLQDLPSPAITTAFTFVIGGVRWQLTTSLLDAGEPKLPKELAYVSLRFERGATGSSTAVLSDAIDGSSTFQGEDSVSTTTVNTDGTVWSEGRVRRIGRTHQIRLAGTSTTGDPQIGEMVALLKVDEGA
jgi:hypothetical protein